MSRQGFGATLGRIGEGMLIALDSVRSNKARAALTILGVAIGVMVVIAMASMITGINTSVVKEIETLGPRTFFVERFFQGGLTISDGSDELSPWRRNPWLTVDEAEMIRQLPLIEDVTWREGTSGPVSYKDVNLSSTQVVGFSASWIGVVGGTVTAGRSFTHAEEAAGSMVAVINDGMAESLFPGLDPVGKRIKIFGQPFQVVGMYVEASSLFNESSPMVAIPHSAFVKVADYFKGWMNIAVVPVPTTTVLEAQDQVIAAMRAKRGLKPSQDNNFAVISQDKIMETFNNITGGFFLVMLALSSIGLMVGGVGVVAIMMISVTERTREIGVRKALGATRAEIMLQFLVEAATLTLLGGIVGMLLGSGLAWAVSSFTPIPAEVPLWSVVIAILVSAVTGIFFGLYPANRASRLDPVDALRYE
jgi:putative ABC transport system permease protein